MDENFWLHLKNEFFEFLFSFGTHIIYAVVVIVLGILVIKLAKKLINRIMKKANTELSLQSFIISLSNLVLYALLIFAVGIIFGIKATSFLAIFGAMALGIGLALQGSLQNFAGGVLILLFKPFKIGDKVIIDGVFGVVNDISILYTTIESWSGIHYTMPNGKVSNNTVENRAKKEARRVQIELHFSFDEDFDRLREIITSAMAKHPKVIQDKPIQLWLSEFDSYSIKASARCWVPTWEFWGVYWDQIEAVKKALEENGVAMAIPKQEIYQPNRNDIKENKKSVA